MNSIKYTSRLAGLLYLIVVVTGIFSLAYVPSKLFVWNNPAETFHNIVSSELLFRMSIVSSLACYTFFLFLPIVLYKLLKHVDENYAKIMVLLAIVSVPISFINIQHKYSVLALIDTAGYLNTFSPEQLQAQVLFYLNKYNSGNQIASIFWGLWLLPFGYLVIKSKFLPSILGILLILGCFGYLINFLGRSLIVNYTNFGISTYISLPATLGEIGICLWLLILGAKYKTSAVTFQNSKV